MNAAHEPDPDEQSRKFSRKRKIAVVLTIVLGAGVTGAWAYTRYVVVKSPLGGTCRYALHCGADAPQCMRPSEDEDGVCSRPCEAGTDCAADVRCIAVELDEIRDERGMPLKGGYCFPQAFLDAKKKRRARDAGALDPHDAGARRDARP